MVLIDIKIQSTHVTCGSCVWESAHSLTCCNPRVCARGASVGLRRHTHEQSSQNAFPPRSNRDPGLFVVCLSVMFLCLHAPLSPGKNAPSICQRAAWRPGCGSAGSASGGRRVGQTSSPGPELWLWPGVQCSRPTGPRTHVSLNRSGRETRSCPDQLTKTLRPGAHGNLILHYPRRSGSGVLIQCSRQLYRTKLPRVTRINCVCAHPPVKYVIHQQANRRVHRCSVSCVAQTFEARNDLGDFVQGLHVIRAQTEIQVNVCGKITVSDTASLFCRCSDLQAPRAAPSS